MIMNSAPQPEENSDEANAKEYAKKLAGYEVERKREFDILRNQSKKPTNVPMDERAGSSLVQESDWGDLVEPSEAELNEFLNYIKDRVPTQLADAETKVPQMKNVGIYPNLKKSWLALLKKSIEIDQVIIDANNDLLAKLRQKNDEESLAVIKQTEDSTKKLLRNLQINRAELGVAEKDPQYWEDTYGTANHTHFQSTGKEFTISPALLTDLQEKIAGHKNLIKELTLRGGAYDQELIAETQKNLQMIENHIALTNSLGTGTKDKQFGKTYIKDTTAISTGEVPGAHGDWEHTKLADTIQ